MAGFFVPLNQGDIIRSTDPPPIHLFAGVGVGEIISHTHLGIFFNIAQVT